jgi:hypothetical protein
MLIVAGGGGSSADRAGAGGVPDLGQVPEPGAGVVAAGLGPVVAVLGGEGDEGDLVLAAVDREGPGAVAAGRPVGAGAGEREAGSRAVPVPGGSWEPGAAAYGAFPVPVAGRIRARWRVPAGR